MFPLLLSLLLGRPMRSSLEAKIVGRLLRRTFVIALVLVSGGLLTSGAGGTILPLP